MPASNCTPTNLLPNDCPHKPTNRAIENAVPEVPVKVLKNVNTGIKIRRVGSQPHALESHVAHGGIISPMRPMLQASNGVSANSQMMRKVETLGIENDDYKDTLVRGLMLFGRLNGLLTTGRFRQLVQDMEEVVEILEKNLSQHHARQSHCRNCAIQQSRGARHRGVAPHANGGAALWHCDAGWHPQHRPRVGRDGHGRHEP